MENRKTRRKNLEAIKRSYKKPNAYMAPGRNRSLTTLAGGQRPHHCAISPSHHCSPGAVMRADNQTEHDMPPLERDFFRGLAFPY